MIIKEYQITSKQYEVILDWLLYSPQLSENIFQFWNSNGYSIEYPLNSIALEECNR